MTAKRDPVAQWTLDVTVFHAPQFGHRVIVRVLGKRAGWDIVGHWDWTGLGIPADLVDDLVAKTAAVICEHLVTRYGIQGVLDVHWAGDPGTT